MRAPEVIYEDEHTCTCGKPATRRVIRTTIPGTKAVPVIHCPSCDRSKCQRCSRIVANPATRACPHCGSPLQFAG